MVESESKAQRHEAALGVGLPTWHRQSTTRKKRTETHASVNRDPGMRGLSSVLVKTMMVRRTMTIMMMMMMMMTEKEEKEAESPRSRRSRRSNGQRSRGKRNGCCCRRACSHLRTFAQPAASARSAPAPGDNVAFSHSTQVSIQCLLIRVSFLPNQSKTASSS